MSEGGRGLRLLMITQELATDSSNLGFAHLWAQELAPLVEQLHVIATATGAVDLPRNVAVHGLGKERGRGRASRRPLLLARCLQLIGGGRVDGVLAHMVPAYAIAAAPTCIARRSPLVLWYASHGRTRALRVGVRLASATITSAPESYPLRSPGAFILGQGIDTARLADAPLMRVLLELGADPALTNEDGTTLLMVASGVGIHSPGEDPGTEAEALACVELALELGGDPNAVDERGETALHGAAYRGANSIVERLIAHGADTFDQENVEGWTPLRIARGVFRTATFKEAPHTAALLGELMAARRP